MKQADFVRSKSFLLAPAKPPADQRQGAKLRLQEGLQRGISLSHQNLGMKQENSAEPLEMHFQVWSCFVLFCFVFSELLAATLIFLKNIYLFYCTESRLWHMESLVAACEIQFPDQELNPGPLP